MQLKIQRVDSAAFTSHIELHIFVFNFRTKSSSFPFVFCLKPGQMTLCVLYEEKNMNEKWICSWWKWNKFLIFSQNIYTLCGLDWISSLLNFFLRVNQSVRESIAFSYSIWYSYEKKNQELSYCHVCLSFQSNTLWKPHPFLFRFTKWYNYKIVKSAENIFSHCFLINRWTFFG